jgi:flagellar motor switch protein FliG
MAKIKTPVWPELSPVENFENNGPKAPLSQGIAAYQNTMKPKESPPRRPPDIPGDGFVKTGETTPGTEDLRSDQKNDDNPFLKLPKVLPRREGEDEGDSKLRRVAKFFILIGGDEAAGILSKLDVEQVEAISREIAAIRGVSGGEAAEILEEFRSLLSSPFNRLGASSGGVETARRLLYAAFGPEKGMAFLNKALPETKGNPFSFLEDFTGEQIALLLKEEFPAAVALILSRLPSKLSAAVLVNIEPGRKMEIVRRIAHQGRTDADVLERVTAALREKARRLGSSVTADNQINPDGRNALAAILKQSDYSFGDRILQELDEKDPELSLELKERLHTLEDVIKAEDRPLQEKFRSMSDQDIAMLLKGKSTEFADKVLSNVSAQRRIEIREEVRIMGPVLRRDADEATRAFLTWFRQCREEGRILLLDDEDVIL